jgi:hypothetical protein
MKGCREFLEKNQKNQKVESTIEVINNNQEL